MLVIPRRYKATVYALFLLMLTMLFIFTLYHIPFNKPQIKDWLTHYSMELFLWRMGLILCIYFSWPFYVRYKTAGRVLSSLQSQTLVQRRYYVVVILAGLECLFSLGSWL